MPMSRFHGGTAEMSLPSTSTRPERGRANPAITRSSVDFPEPEGPSSAKNSPGSMARLILRSTSVLPNASAMSWNSTLTLAMFAYLSACSVSKRRLRVRMMRCEA